MLHVNNAILPSFVNGIRINANLQALAQNIVHYYYWLMYVCISYWPLRKGVALRTAVAKSSLFEYFTCISELLLSNHGREPIYLHQLAPRLLLHGVLEISQLQLLRPRHLRLLLDHNALSPTYLSVLFATYRLSKDWGECRLGGECELNIMIVVNTARYV